MKDKLQLIIESVFLVFVLIGYGCVTIYLGLKLPYQLWIDGYWGFAIVQAIVVWSWLLGGKRE